MNKLATVLIAFAMVACSKKEPASSGPPIPAFDPAAEMKKFEGKTFVITGSMGFREAWSFADGKVTIDDGETSQTGKLVIATPCVLMARIPRSDGIEAIKSAAFTWNGSTLHLGSGYGGVKRGNTYVACYGDADQYVFDGKSCTYGGKPAKCKLEGDTLVTDQVKFTIAGDAMFDERLKASIAEPVADLAAGKAKVARP